MVIVAIAFGGVAVSHLVADNASVALIFDNTMAANADSPAIYLSSITKGFFWLVVTATAMGIALSFTPARSYEGAPLQAKWAPSSCTSWWPPLA